MRHEKFDSWDEFDVELPIQQTSAPTPAESGAEVPAESGAEVPAPLTKQRGGRRKKQVETPVEITEEVEPVEENTDKEV